MQNKPMTVEQVRNLPPEELGDMLIELSKKGMERPSLATRVEEAAARIQQQVTINADIYTGCRIKNGACEMWIMSIGSPGGPMTMTLQATYDQGEDNFQVTWRVYHKREAIINKSQRTVEPQPENYEEIAVKAVTAAHEKIMKKRAEEQEVGPETN